MKTNKTTSLLLAETQKQQERFERLYGPGDYCAPIEKQLKHTVWLIGVATILFGFVLVLQLSKSTLASQGVVLDGNGNIISVERPSAGSATMVLGADVITDSGKNLIGQDIQLMISAKQPTGNTDPTKNPERVEDNEDVAQHEIRKAIYQLNLDTSSSTVALPKKLSDGTRIYWVPKKANNGLFMLLICILAIYGIFRNRDAALKRTERNASASVLRELPEFVNKMVLLLNAGLILSNAFNKIVSDYQKIRGGECNYFYGQLMEIMTKSIATNGSLQQELRYFAVRTGVVEFMRLSNIISDSMTKGSDLMTQLKMEGDSLWAARRKQMEEKGRIAETKLTFPLVILLLVLVMITIAPAMMEM